MHIETQNAMFQSNTCVLWQCGKCLTDGHQCRDKAWGTSTYVLSAITEYHVVSISRIPNNTDPIVKEVTGVSAANILDATLSVALGNEHLEFWRCSLCLLLVNSRVGKFSCVQNLPPFNEQTPGAFYLRHLKAKMSCSFQFIIIIRFITDLV
jgi:hypothetical protein